MPELSWAEWDTKAQYRYLHYKYKEQLDWLKDFYPEKIDRLQRWLADILAGHMGETEGNIILLQEKITRLTDKFQTTLKEIEGRELGHFPNRPEHGTIYYIDLDGGNDGDTGLDKDHAWLTLAQFTVVLAKNPGDLAKVRAATDEAMGGNLAFDEDGDEDDYIEIRGCSVADDPWGDASNVKPILTFGDNDAHAEMDNNFWEINRMVIKESAHSYGGLRILNAIFVYLKDCEFTDASHGTTARGASLLIGYNVFFDGCAFEDNIHQNLYLHSQCSVRLESCTFNGGALGTDFGIYTGATQAGRIIEAIDCDFGQTTPHDTEDIRLDRWGDIIKLRNCKLDKGTVSVNDWTSVAFEEDTDGTYGAGRITYYHGTVTKDTGIKTGAATFSCKMEPNTNCGSANPLTLNNDSLIEFPFIIKCDASVQKTVTIKIRSIDAWAVYPTNTQLYIEALYLDHAVDASRTAIASTQVLSHASDWVSFTVTFTPLQTGVAYIAVYLNKFEAAKGCYVNMEAT